MPVLIILAVLWAVVLVPPVLRARSQRSADSIVDFNYKLDVLGRTGGNRRRRARGPVSGAAVPDVSVPGATMPVLLAAPMSSHAMSSHAMSSHAMSSRAMSSSAAQRSARRRGQVLRVLAFAVASTLLLALTAHVAVAWVLQVLVDLAAVAYLAMWAWLRNVQAERLDKVRYIPDLRVPELRHPAMALRRSASS